MSGHAIASVLEFKVSLYKKTSVSYPSHSTPPFTQVLLVASRGIAVGDVITQIAQLNYENIPSDLQKNTGSHSHFIRKTMFVNFAFEVIIMQSM